MSMSSKLVQQLLDEATKANEKWQLEQVEKLKKDTKVFMDEISLPTKTMMASWKTRFKELQTHITTAKMLMMFGNTRVKDAISETTWDQIFLPLVSLVEALQETAMKTLNNELILAQRDLWIQSFNLVEILFNHWDTNTTLEEMQPYYSHMTLIWNLITETELKIANVLPEIRQSQFQLQFIEKIGQRMSRYYNPDHLLDSTTRSLDLKCLGRTYKYRSTSEALTYETKYKLLLAQRILLTRLDKSYINASEKMEHPGCTPDNKRKFERILREHKFQISQLKMQMITLLIEIKDKIKYGEFAMLAFEVAQEETQLEKNALVLMRRYKSEIPALYSREDLNDILRDADSKCTREDSDLVRLIRAGLESDATELQQIVDASFLIGMTSRPFMQGSTPIPPATPSPAPSETAPKKVQKKKKETSRVKSTAVYKKKRGASSLKASTPVYVAAAKDLIATIAKSGNVRKRVRTDRAPSASK